MMQRSIKTSGGSDHVELVKLASKRLIDEFEELNEIVLNYEAELDVDVQFGENRGYGRTNARFNFRPDIIVTTINYVFNEQVDPDKRFIWQAHKVLFEAETDPRNIFKNVLKIECYKKMKRGRLLECAFVLVCFDDAVLPKDTSPFDEIWKFERPSGVE